MKDYARNIDSLGRIVLPIEIRKANNLKEGDLLYITMTDSGILLKPVSDACEICGALENVTVRNGIRICHSCFKKLTK